MRKKEDTQTHEKTWAMNPLHPSAAMNVSLKTGLFLWAWSLRAHDVQDTVGTSVLNENSPENRTWDPKYWVLCKFHPQCAEAPATHITLLNAVEVTCFSMWQVLAAGIMVSSFGIKHLSPWCCPSSVPPLLGSQHNTTQTKPNQTLSQHKGANALLANLHAGHHEDESRHQVYLQGIWSRPVLLLCLLNH